MNKKIDKQELVKISLLSAIELYKIQQKSGGLLSEPVNIERMVIAIDQKDFNLNVIGDVLEICKTITMILLMDEQLVKSIVIRESTNQFSGLTSDDWKYFQNLLVKNFPDFLN
jgi:hypothetical protein